MADTRVSLCGVALDNPLIAASGICGFGACMGCTCQTNFGPKRVCLDGPVFRKEEVLWQIRA